MPKGRIAHTLEDFWPYVEKSTEDKCWLWKGTIHRSGYGSFPINRKQYQAHRVAFYLAFPGAIDLRAPADKKLRKFVLHRCDVRRCCNPKHLFLGSIADNTADMVCKMRQRGLKGESNPASKLSHGDVKRIQKLLADGKMSQWDIARIFGICQGTVSNIKLGKSYPMVI